MLFRQIQFFLASFFPVNLLILHLRRSQLMLCFWLLLFLITGNYILEDYGIPLLFLLPEYRGTTDFWSYFFVGLCLGLFIMAFHIASYIFYSYRYRFLATLNRPIYKFSINNSTIPLIFILYYTIKLASFLSNMDTGFYTIFTWISGLYLGVILMIAFVFAYFFSVNRVEESEEGKPIKSLRNVLENAILRKEKNAEDAIQHQNESVHTYLKNFISLRITRPADHYAYSRLIQALQQHHAKATYFFFILIGILLVLGALSDYTIIQIPAAATGMIMLSLYLMIAGAFYSRFRAWSATIAVILVLGLNYISEKGPFYKPHYAAGLDYDTIPAEFDRPTLISLTTDSIVDQDFDHWIHMLNNWKAKQKSPKPKLVILNVSGGGLRSSLWTYEILNTLDSLSKGGFHDHIALITGSSGGMLGAAFFREIKWLEEFRWPLYESPDRNFLKQKFSQDLLNPTIFNLVVNDLFFRFYKYEYEGRSYLKDRGYSFDQTFDKNTLGVLNHRLGDYTEKEFLMQMPPMIFGPIMIQDGRRLIISSQPTSFLTFSKNKHSPYGEKIFDGLEFQRVFKTQDAPNISFLTVLRMSSSFPYITPLINMPSQPDIQLIDAGVRDNDGFEVGLRFCFHFKEWIAENTSGVVFIRIKADRAEDEPLFSHDFSRRKLNQLIRPITGVVKSFSNLQVYNKSIFRKFGVESMNFPVEQVTFSLFRPYEQENLALSWRLTPIERKRLLISLDRMENQRSFEEVGTILKLEGTRPKGIPYKTE